MTNSGQWMDKYAGERDVVHQRFQENQLELMTIIDHGCEDIKARERAQIEDTHKPSGVRLAKMLSQYEDQPSSQLWSDIQRLAREILK